MTFTISDTKTAAFLRRLHDWSIKRGRIVFIATYLLIIFGFPAWMGAMVLEDMAHELKEIWEATA